MTSPLLPLTLHALDHLDQAALKRQAEALIVQVHPEANPVQIQAAVEASWEALPVQLPQVDVPTGSFSFGWRRPATPEVAHRKQVTWAARRDRWLEKDWFMWLAVGISLGLTGVAVCSPLFFLKPGEEVAFIPNFPLSLFGGVLTLMASLKTIEYVAAEGHRYAVCDREIDFSPFLQMGATRAYLRAVLSSPVPDVLWGDVWRLNTLLERATRPARKAEQKQACKVAKIESRQAKVAARQAKIQAKADQRVDQERARQAELATAHRMAQANRCRLLAQMEPSSLAD